MSKFHVKDDEGNEYVVEEQNSDISPETTSSQLELSQDDIASLKKLALMADKLLALCGQQDDGEKLPEEEPKEQIEQDSKEQEKEPGEEEEVVNTEKTNDSKASFGSIQKKKETKDSMDIEESIAQAWAKRYGGNK